MEHGTYGLGDLILLFFPCLFLMVVEGGEGEEGEERGERGEKSASSTIPNTL